MAIGRMFGLPVEDAMGSGKHVTRIQDGTPAAVSIKSPNRNLRKRKKVSHKFTLSIAQMFVPINIYNSM